MLNTWMTKVLGESWRTNAVSVLAFLYTVPQVVAAVTAYINHQPADWRGAATGTLIAAGLWLAKDKQVHSTMAQVEAASQQPKGDK
jgi:drug/metabolite transporter (DMT)-like permease